MIPEVGKMYKHYKGKVYQVVDVKNENVTVISGKDIYTIGLDMWNTPVVTDNNIMIERFTKQTRKR